MKYDIQLDIATGSSRTQKKYKNQKMMWSELAKRLGNTVRTPESIEEYFKMPKSKQDDIKDVGGFVGGYLMDGRRTHVKHRQVICLDADFGGLDEVWDTWCILRGNASAMYSTHKHTPEKPRMRLVIPLDRRVSPEEYEAIARKIASELGMDAFDDTTYQPQRLMYWPSTSRNGEYLYEVLDAPILSADGVLASYEDWHDISSWPTSSRVTEVLSKAMKKQQDPMDKDGAIGAFCRAYSIQEAIEKFVPEYTPCDIPNRYTYTKGSTSAGIVIYDDKFSYSNHATDPASSILCNAFDLVRIHKFGALDEDAKADTPVNRMPSFKAMTDFALNDDEVKVQRFKELAADFDSYSTEPTSGVQDGSTENDIEWVKKLQVDRNGNLLSNAHNIELILENDPDIKGALGYDELYKNVVALKDLPWRKVHKFDRGLSDSDDAYFRSFFSKRYGIEGEKKIFDAVNVVAHKYAFHPIKDYLDSLVWDGRRRIDRIFIDYFNCDDNDYTRAVTRKTLVAAVARIYEPGIKFDYMLTLKGLQGSGKSTFFDRLSRGFFSDSLKDISSKDAMEHLQGVWIIEMAEMSAMKKADENLIKSFLSSRVDRFRMAYGRRTGEFPRQCIFVGTTNEDEILKDYTGNRRFWVVASKDGKPKKDPFDITDAEFDQFWAEAKAIYDKGEERLMLDRELEQEAENYRESFMLEDPREGIIRDYLDRPITKDWYEMDKFERKQFIQEGAKGDVMREKVCALEIWTEALGNSEKDMASFRAAEINKIVARIGGWRRKAGLTIKGYGKQRGYVRSQN